MIVVLYSKDGGQTKKVATAYKNQTLDQIKAQGWGNNSNVCDYYEVDDGNTQDLGGGVWKCSLTTEEVLGQGAKL